MSVFETGIYVWEASWPLTLNVGNLATVVQFRQWSGVNRRTCVSFGDHIMRPWFPNRFAADGFSFRWWGMQVNSAAWEANRNCPSWDDTSDPWTSLLSSSVGGWDDGAGIWIVNSWSDKSENAHIWNRREKDGSWCCWWAQQQKIEMIYDLQNEVLINACPRM